VVIGGSGARGFNEGLAAVADKDRERSKQGKRESRRARFATIGPLAFLSRLEQQMARP